MPETRQSVNLLKEIFIALLCGGSLFAAYATFPHIVARVKASIVIEPLHRGSTVPSISHLTSRDNKRLVIAISSTCQYSNKSLPFYSYLISRAKAAGIPAYFLVPDKQSAHLVHKTLSAEPSQIFVTNLRDEGITGTPTLAVVDTQSRVLRYWVGQLPPAEQTIVSTKILSSDHVISSPVWPTVTIVRPDGASNFGKTSDESIPANATDFQVNAVETVSDATLNDRISDLKVVDISPRPEFNAGHESGALNIPLEELAVRSQRELGSKEKIMVDCSAVGPSDCDAAAYTLYKLGFSKFTMLDRGAGGAFCKMTPTE